MNDDIPIVFEICVYIFAIIGFAEFVRTHDIISIIFVTSFLLYGGFKKFKELKEGVLK